MGFDCFDLELRALPHEREFEVEGGSRAKCGHKSNLVLVRLLLKTKTLVTLVNAVLWLASTNRPCRSYGQDHDGDEGGVGLWPLHRLDG